MLTNLAYWIVNSDARIWWLIGICAVTGFSGFAMYRAGLHRSRLLENIPRSLLRSAAQGYVELHGTGRQLPGEPILAPLTRLPCVWYRFSIKQRRRDSKGNSRWVTVESGRSDNHFELVDETGICIIDPDGADVEAAASDTWSGNTRWPDPTVSPSRRNRFLGQYRYHEQRLHDGDPIFVLGHYQTRTLRLGTDEAVNALLKEWKQDQITLIERFDSNRDGNIDAEEWTGAREAAEREVQRSQLAPAPEPVNIVSRPGESDRPYIISSRPESELIRRYRRQVWIGMALFLIFGSMAIWMGTVRLGGP